MTTAVTGATGQLGRLVINGLKEAIQAEDILALARSPERAADLGVPARAFDYDDPTTLDAGLAGVDTLLLISGSDIGQRIPQHKAVIDAAKAVGVGHIVYTSLLHADTSSVSLAPEHSATEVMLRDSGIDHTILRNGWYTENYTAGLPQAVEHNALIGAAGDGAISSASRADYAAAAVAVLIKPELQGATYELAGDESYTLADLAGVLSDTVGKTIPYVNMAEADYAKALEQAGLPAPFAAFLAGADVSVSQGQLFDDGKANTLLPNRPSTGDFVI
jgi:NAD(P)H dehydrogenase (quinone)